jgi:hypothetical protein
MGHFHLWWNFFDVTEIRVASIFRIKRLSPPNNQQEAGV